MAHEDVRTADERYDLRTYGNPWYEHDGNAWYERMCPYLGIPVPRSMWLYSDVGINEYNATSQASGATRLIKALHVKDTISMSGHAGYVHEAVLSAGRGDVSRTRRAAAGAAAAAPVRA